VKYLLDTHVLVWWLFDDRRLGKTDRRVLGRAEARREPVGVSAISLWEVARLASSGRIRLEEQIDEALEQIESSARLAVLPLTARIAADSMRLGVAFPTDPVDQIIAATARCHGLTLLTHDERIRASGAVSVLD
jgi:PIN domain nuclease of toxin-antitoxin system